MDEENEGFKTKEHYMYQDIIDSAYISEMQEKADKVYFTNI